MTRDRAARLLLVVLIAGSLVLVAGSGAFSAGTAERAVGVGVAGNPGELDVEVHEPTANSNATVALVTVTANHGSSALRLAVDVGRPDVAAFEQTPGEDWLSPGESRTIRAEIDCDGTARETIPVRIVASNDGFATVVHRNVTVTCERS